MGVKKVCLVILVFVVGLIGLSWIQGIGLAAKEKNYFTNDQLYASNIMVAQNDNQLAVNFDLVNTNFIQPDVVYALIIGRETDDGFVNVVDWKKESEILTLSPDQILNKTIVYDIPDYLSGEFLIGVEVANSSGHVFSTIYDGEKIELDNQNFTLKLEDCLLKARKGAGEVKQYSQKQNIVLEKADNLHVECEVLNNTKQTISVFPKVDWYWRQMLGEKIELKDIKFGQYQILPGKNNIELNLTKPIDWKPQVYNLVIQFTDISNKQVTTNKQLLTVNLAGVTTAIDNVRLEKGGYSTGEIADIEVTWWPSYKILDNKEEQIDVSNQYNVVVELWNKEGNKCGEDVTKNFQDNETNSDIFSIAVSKECRDPQVIVSIRGENGVILDKKNYHVFSFESENDSREENDKTVVVMTNLPDFSLTGWYLLVVVLVMIFILLLVLWKHGRNNVIRLATLFFCILSFALSIKTVRAASWSWNGTSYGNVVNCPRDGINQTTVNVSTDNNTYRANTGSIVITVSVWTQSNSGFYIDLINDNGQSTSVGQFNRYNAGGGTVNRMVYFSVPGNAGNHGLTVRINHTCVRNNQTTLYYTVTPADLYPPTISNIYPTNWGAPLCSNYVDLSGNIWDQDGECNLTATFGNDLVVAGISRSGLCNGSWFNSGAKWFSNGNHVWKVQGFDSYGHIGQEYWQGFKVNTPPTISLSCNSNTYTQPQNICLYTSVSDPDGNQSPSITVNGMGTYGGTSFCYSFNPGTYSWYGTVRDSCNQSAQTGVCTFRVNGVPSVTSTSTSSSCGSVTLYATAIHNGSPGDVAKMTFYVNGSARCVYDNFSSLVQYPCNIATGNNNNSISWYVVVSDTNNTSNSQSGSPVTPNCPPYPPDNLSEFINCRNVTLRAHVSDPDGTGRNLRVVFHPTVSFSGNNIVESAISDSSPSVNLVLPFDSLFTWSVDVTDNLSTPVTTYRNVNLSTDHSPQNKTSYIIDPKNSTTYPANANPRFSIDYDKLRLQPVTINDYSYDADTLNQTIPGTYDYNQDTYKQRVQAALSLSVNGVGQGSISKVDPYQLTNGYYYHNIPLANLYAGNWSYTMQDTDACGAISGAVSGSFVIAPPAVKNVRDATGDSGCPLCGGRKTNIRIEWDEVPYITNARNTSTNPDAHLYYAEWTNNDPSRMSALCGSYLLDGKWCPVTKPSSHPDYNLGSGYVRGSSIILETDVLDLYDLSTSTPRNIHYRVRSYSNGVFSDWVVYPAVDQPAITYNCPIPGGLLIFPPTSNDPDIPLEIRADEDSTQLTAKLRCQLFKTKKWSDAYGDDLISAARSNRIYSPETNPVTFVWDPLAELDLCSSGSIIKNTPPDPGNILHAGTSTVMDSCEGTIRATVRNFGWSDVGLNELTGYRKIVIDPRATEEFNYSGEVISNPPPGFEKLDLPGVQ